MAPSPNTIMPTRDDQLKKLGDLIVGLQKHEQDLATFVISDKKYTVAEVIAVLQARYDATQSVVTTKATWQAAVKLDHEGRASGQVFLTGVRQTVLTAFAGSVDKLADFGLVGRKPRSVSPEAQVATTAKAKATRAARHTMGKRQKALIHGTVPASAPLPSAPAPVAAPPATTVPTAPAPSVATQLATPPAASRS